jgi:hypothetical protein
MNLFRNRQTLVLTILAAGSLLINLLHLAHFGIRPGGDTPRYVVAAANLAAGRLVLDYSTLFHSGYVSLIALSESVGAGFAGVVGLQLACAALATFALFALADEMAGHVAGTLAAIFFVADLDLAMWHVYLLTDSIYTSLVILTTWLVHRAVGRGGRAYVGAAIAVVATASIRPNGYLFFPVAAIYWVGRTRLAPRTKIAAACLLTVAVASVVVIAAWQRSRSPLPPPDRVGKTYLDLRDNTVVVGEWMDWLGLREGGDRTRLARTVGNRVLGLFLHVRWYDSTRHKAIVYASLGVIYPLALAGLIRLRRRPLALLMSAVIAGHVAIVAVTFNDKDGRYLQYILPLIAVFAASGASAVVSRLWRRPDPARWDTPIETA